MLGRVELTAGIEGDANRVPNTGSISLGGREALVCFVRIVTPDSGASLKLGAWLVARRSSHSAFYLARVGRRANVHEDVAACVDHERVHRVVTVRWQIPYDCLRCGRSGSHAVW